MKIHVIQHVSFEGLASLEGALRDRGAVLTYTRLYEKAVFPDVRAIDGLVIMGGPMGVNDGVEYPWLRSETSFARRFLLETSKPALGICLGAQMIAHALGAPVTKNAEKEIGWFPVTRNENIPESWKSVFPETFDAFHWHGETFALPEGAVRLASSGACRNQAFIWKDRALALQFHLECTAESVGRFIEHAGNDLDGSSRYVSRREELAGTQPSRFERANTLMRSVAAALFH